MKILVDIVHYDAPLGLGLVLQRLGHEWYVPFTTRWENVAMSPPPLSEGYLNLETERFVIYGARVYHDLQMLKAGLFDLVITSRWDKFLSIAALKHRRTRLAFYLADRFWRPPGGTNVIGGVKGPWYFTKRVPDYWFRERLRIVRETMLTSMTSHVERRNAELHGSLEKKGDPFSSVLQGIRRGKIPYRLFGRDCEHGWCYDQVAYDCMTHLLHVKCWGSGSDWAVLKACAKGIPCVVYRPYVVGTMHEEILPRSANLFLTWNDVQSNAWTKKIEGLDGEENRTALRALYNKGVPEAQVDALLRRMK